MIFNSDRFLRQNDYQQQVMQETNNLGNILTSTTRFDCHILNRFELSISVQLFWTLRQQATSKARHKTQKSSQNMKKKQNKSESNNLHTKMFFEGRKKRITTKHNPAITLKAYTCSLSPRYCVRLPCLPDPNLLLSLNSNCVCMDKESFRFHD